MAVPPTMYQLLVPNPSDALAALAYAAFKQHEVQVMDAIVSATGAPPTQLDIDGFYRAASAPAMLDMYEQHAQALMNAFLEETLESRRNVLETEFASTKIGQQLLAIQEKQREKKGWKGWAADVSGNLAVNFVTILVIAALLFGFNGLDKMLGDFGRNSGVIDSHNAVPK
jgi:hypothetical protein